MLEKLPENIETKFSVTGEVTFPQGTSVSYTRIIKRIWHYGLSVFLVFFVSFSVYPAVTVLIESQYKGKGSAWSGKFTFKFYATYEITTFNIFCRCVLYTCGDLSYF